MKRYVVGFLFGRVERVNPNNMAKLLMPPRVALVRKNRPAWQRNRLNGIGGKIEGDETPAEAMRREFLEEAGLDIRSWHEFCRLSNDDVHYRVHFFRAFCSFETLFNEVRSQTDERIEIVNAQQLPSDTIYNLHWLIPMSFDRCIEQRITVKEERF